MDLDNITDIETLRNICKRNMVCLSKTIETPMYTFKKGEWYFYIQEGNGVHLYFNNTTPELFLTYEEAERCLV